MGILDVLLWQVIDWYVHCNTISWCHDDYMVPAVNITALPHQVEEKAAS